MFEIWHLEPDLICDVSMRGIGPEMLRDSVHAMVKLGTQQRDKVYRISVFSMIFSLIDKLAEVQNKEAPVVFKSLVGALIDHYKKRWRDQVTAEFVLKNVLTLFAE